MLCGAYLRASKWKQKQKPKLNKLYQKLWREQNWLLVNSSIRSEAEFFVTKNKWENEKKNILKKLNKLWFKKRDSEKKILSQKCNDLLLDENISHLFAFIFHFGLEFECCSISVENQLNLSIFNSANQ